jgi:hypothetical protein
MVIEDFALLAIASELIKRSYQNFSCGYPSLEARKDVDLPIQTSSLQMLG